MGSPPGLVWVPHLPLVSPCPAPLGFPGWPAQYAPWAEVPGPGGGCGSQSAQAVCLSHVEVGEGILQALKQQEMAL